MGFMVGVTLLWVWSYLLLFVLGKWDQWDCLTSLPIYGLKHYFGMQRTVAPGRLPFLDAMFSKWTVISKFCPISFGFLNGLRLLLILHLVCSFWSESLRYKQYESQVHRVLDLYSFIYIIHLRKLLNFYNLKKKIFLAFWNLE